MEIRLETDLTRETAGTLYRDLRRRLQRCRDGEIRLVLAESVRLDNVGIGLLETLAREAAARGCPLRLAGVGSRAERLLGIHRAPEPGGVPEPREVGFFERTGDQVVRAATHVFDFAVLTADSFFLTAAALVRGRLPWRTFVEQSVRLGADSLPIIALISFLVGLTTALQAAYQLLQFGANIYIADLVGVAMVVELGPLMTAIVMAGRSGSSMAAEISSMVIAEEVDALRTMGINPVRYVLSPKLLALVFTTPLLTVLSMVVGIGGGVLVALFYLDLSFTAFWNEMIDALALRDLLVSLLKAMTFAVLIGLTAGHVGFRASGGASGVGRATTASVVASIFLVIVFDAAYSLIFYFG
ncbi:MAG: MlaE family lipid ABC transporter permease subunit [Deltaproteobacteria bacterium]|nr:MlaE family lipid ABC transporter permease subunit [Deltaproteobacteria bacterium]